jgi:hypothetical protein
MRLLAVALCLSLSAACAESVTAPSSTTPAPAALRIVVPAQGASVVVGQPVVWTAVATMADGSTATVNATWVSDAPAVATVTSGRVAGIAPGRATIAASYSGVVASIATRVIPDYSGPWIGAAVYLGCDGFQDSRVCAGFHEGTVGQVGLVVQQTGDAVTATLDLRYSRRDVAGNLYQVHQAFTVSGAIEEDGTLVLASPSWPREQWVIAAWRATPDVSGVLRGAFTQAAAGQGLGNAYIATHSWTLKELMRGQ